MLGSISQYPIYGPTVQCPHCRQSIPALLLTDSYLCDRHGAFEVNPETQELVHVQSGRHWRRWEDRWYRQHTHPDGVRFEIHEELDRLYTQGFRATRVVIAQRYEQLMLPYLEHSAAWPAARRNALSEPQPSSRHSAKVSSEGQTQDAQTPDSQLPKCEAEPKEIPKLYGLPVTFSQHATEDERWSIINFDLEKEPGVPTQYRYLKIYE